MSSASALSLFLFAETSIHPGTGSTLSHIDLPIQREVHTQHPIIYASGWKGALRTVFESKWSQAGQSKTDCIFGAEKSSGSAGQGIFQEARVALFPVRSMKGTYAWITCPLVIQRLQRDLLSLQAMLSDSGKAEAKKFLNLVIPEIKEGAGFFPGGNGLLIDGEVAVFEDYEYTEPINDDPTVQEERRQKAREFAGLLAGWFSRNSLPTSNAYEWWRKKMLTDVVVISDDEFTHFVKMHTEVQPHVKIGLAGTVEAGPWTEEALPGRHGPVHKSHDSGLERESHFFILDSRALGRREGRID